MTTQALRRLKVTLKEKRTINTDTDTKCSICLEGVRFPMSNGCCSYKFCKSCFNIMPQNHKAKCGGCRQNTVFSTITSTEYGRIIRRQRTLINELKENKELLEDKLRLAEGKESSLNSALDTLAVQIQETERAGRNRVEKIMTTYDEIILDKMSDQNMLIEKNAKCGDELYQKNILIADLNKEIVKNHELYKFNTIMSYLAIVVAILQYFL